MAGMQHYPPAPAVHHPECDDIPMALASQAMATAEIAQRHPNGVPHNCYHPTVDPRGVVVRVVYPPHEYKPSTVFPDGAVRAQCEVCKGTHQGEIIVNAARPTPSRLILPTNRAPSQIILPGNVHPGTRRNTRSRPPS